MQFAQPFAGLSDWCGAVWCTALRIRAVLDAETTDVCRVHAARDPAEAFCAVLDADAFGTRFRFAGRNSAEQPHSVFVAVPVVLCIRLAAGSRAHPKRAVPAAETTCVRVGVAAVCAAEPVPAVLDTHALRLCVGLTPWGRANSVCTMTVAQPSPLRARLTPFPLADPFRAVLGAEALAGGVGGAAVERAVDRAAVPLAQTKDFCERDTIRLRTHFYHSSIWHHPVRFFVHGLSSRRRHGRAALLLGRTHSLLRTCNRCSLP